MIDKSILTKAEIWYIRDNFYKVYGHRLYDFDLIATAILPADGGRIVTYIPKDIPVALRKPVLE